jgi:DNA primase
MDDLELIKQKINIVDLVSEYLPLKKAGVNFKTNCPFHNEKTASFMVSPERQIFHCFGCGKGGDIFKFLMEQDSLDFKDALELLAKRAGVVLKKSSQKKDGRDRLLEANLKAEEFFHYILISHSLGSNAKDYLIKRGVSEESIKNFNLGYAPNSWESLTKFLLKRGFTVAELIAAGLAVESKHGCYDRFRGRIIYPMRDAKEKIIGFSGRVLDGGEPKYINTPQTVLFDKSNFLYGINLAKGEIRSKDEAVLVEGEMDVIMSHQSGIKNVVASKGTGLTDGQIELLKKYTQNISLCFDMDLAGDSASRRGIDLAEAGGFNIKMISVKEGKDPAEVILKDPQLWQEAINSATPIFDYYLDSAVRRHNLKDPAGIRKVSSELIPIWAKISDDLVRERYIQKLAALLRTEDSVIRETVNKQRLAQAKPYTQVLYSKVDGRPNLRSDDLKIISPQTRRELLEEYLASLLLHIPADHTFVPAFPETLFVSENLKQIYVFLFLYLDSISFKARSFDINEFIKDLPEEQRVVVDRLYLVELDSKLGSKVAWQKETDSVISELKKALVKASLEKLSFEIKNAEEFGKIEVVENLNRRFRDLSVKLKNL